MLASSGRLWLFAALALPLSCVCKGWLTDANNKEFLSEISASRTVLDQPLDRETGPRVLIAGGSNAASGYDSAVITQATGLPTYNLALLDEGLQFRNVFEVVETRARKGDIVILSSLRFLVAQRHGGNLREQTIGRDRWQIPTGSLPVRIGESTAWLPFAPLFGEATLVRTLLNYRLWRSATAEEGSASKGRAALPSLPYVEFDTHGDWINCTERKAPAALVYNRELSAQSQPYLDAVKAFAGRLRDRGVQLRLTIPTVLIKEADRDRWMAQISGLLGGDRGAEFIPYNASRHLSSDINRFCDTNAHVIRAEAVENSEAIIKSVNQLQWTESL